MTTNTIVRRFARWLLRGAVVVLVIAVLYVGLLVFPYPLFPLHTAYEGFSVYSDRELPAGFDDAIRDARRRIQAMELYRSGESYRVFLSQSQRRYAALCAMTRKRSDTQGLVLTLAGSIILSKSGISSMRARTGGRPEYSRFEGSLGEAIAHEVAHLQIVDELGYRAGTSLPFWKTEGYVEYAANLALIRDDPEYDLAARARHWLDDSAWRPPYRPIDRRHFGWQLLVEFLCSVRGHDFRQLIEPSVTEQWAEAELLQWLSTSPPE